MEVEENATAQVEVDNMEIWNLVKAVPKEMTRPFNNGRFSGTDIKPIWRFQILTDSFGPCGFGWYIGNVKFWLQEGAEGVIKSNCELDLFVKHPKNNEWSMPIHGVGGNTFVAKSAKGMSTDDEAYKAAYTDAISVACKALGIAADIYAGNPGLDSSKYAQYYDEVKGVAKGKTTTSKPESATRAEVHTAQQTGKPTKEDAQQQSMLDTAITEMRAARSIEELRSVYIKYINLKDNPEFRTSSIEISKKFKQ